MAVLTDTGGAVAVANAQRSGWTPVTSTATLCADGKMKVIPLHQIQTDNHKKCINMI
jgi:hypothetical protein